MGAWRWACEDGVAAWDDNAEEVSGGRGVSAGGTFGRDVKLGDVEWAMACVEGRWEGKGWVVWYKERRFEKGFLLTFIVEGDGNFESLELKSIGIHTESCDESSKSFKMPMQIPSHCYDNIVGCRKRSIRQRKGTHPDAVVVIVLSVVFGIILLAL